MTLPAPDRLVFASTGPSHHYFGYYDKSPLDRTQTRLLCLRVNFTGRLPDADDVAEVGYFELATGAFRWLGDTRAFNWQQGCMLQWLGPDFDRYVLYNDRDGDRFVSVVLDTLTGERTVMPFPVYTVHPNGQMALSVDFERHYFPRRAYAYPGIVRPEKSDRLVESDGIFRLDFRTRTVERILSVRQLHDRAHVSAMDFGPHYVEHLMLSPSGDRFLFLHRWVLEDGGIYSRLYSAAPDGTDLRLLLDGGKATHFTWRGDRHVLVWGAAPTPLAKLRRHRHLVKLLLKPLLPVYHRLVDARSPVAQRLVGASYLLIEDREGATPQRFAPETLTEDGHPSWNPTHPDWLVTDTYQDATQHQRLWLYHEPSGQRLEVGRFYTPPEASNSAWRCDLHPRWDYSGRYLSVDSMHDGHRQIYLFDAAGWLREETAHGDP